MKSKKLRKKSILFVLLQIVPPGRVTTYGSLAGLLRTSPRAVARMLKSNRSPVVIPCHRVIASSGDVGGYTIGGSVNRELKRRLLELEGVKFSGDRVSDECVLRLDELLLGRSDSSS